MNKHFNVLPHCTLYKSLYILCLVIGQQTLSGQTAGARKINDDVKLQCNKLSNNVSIEFSARNEILNLLVIVTDSIGNTIFLENQYRFKGNYKRLINFTSHPKGKYQVKIIGDEQKINRKLDVQ